MTAQWYTRILEYCDGTMVRRHGTLVPVYWDTVTAVVHRHGTVVHRHGKVVTVTAHWYTVTAQWSPLRHTGALSRHSGIPVHWSTVTA